MGGERAALMATDPPYLVDYTGGAHPASAANHGAPGKDKHWDTYIDHAHSVEFYGDFLRVALDEALSGDAAIYQCYGIMRSEVIWAAWKKVGLLAHQVVVWKKTRSVLTYSWFMWDYEPVLVGWPAGHQPKSRPPAAERAVWEIAKHDRRRCDGDPCHPEAGRARAPADRLAHRARRPALRALRGFRDGPDRRRDERPGAAMPSSSPPPFVTRSWHAGSASPARAPSLGVPHEPRKQSRTRAPHR